MKKTILLILTLAATLSVMSCFGKKADKMPTKITLSKQQLMDKIKGGWAGQTIGCTYGGPTEFKFNGSMVQDYVQIPWDDHRIKWYYDNIPGLYDDIYMDLTFVDVFNRYGIDVSVDSCAMAFAKADFLLCHANQAGRYNILNGIMPPESGHWINNPHANDIDFQIEADFAGLMAPGMPNTASHICDGIGHIMNYGDGWYGGVYVAAMYSLAFVSNDVEFIVTEALKTIPEQSIYYQCISDAIKWHKEFPNDWKRSWFELEKKWSSDIACPDGIFAVFNIDASINSAYVVLGLLYGQGDFYKTMDISTRCGQDSDCNPATAGGILGTMLGYSNIPEYWMTSLREVEDMNFCYTNISLNKTYKMSFDQALQVVERNGGSVDGENVTITCQTPVPVRYEKAFDGVYPTERINVWKSVDKITDVKFNGTGVMFRGEVKCPDNKYVAEVEMYIDGTLVETAKLPVAYNVRRHELFWKYLLPKADHIVTFKWLNPVKDATVNFTDGIVFSDALVEHKHQ